MKASGKIIVGAAAASMLWSGAAIAQEAAEPPTAAADGGTPTETDDIIVTASKVGQSLDRAPVSATTVGGDELARLNVQSVRDAQIRLPSLVYNDSGGSAQVYIRGIGTNSAYAGLESSIGTYVDGVYLQRQVGAAVDVVDLRDIQVLNGPQGSLYGRNATGGVILINTNDPVDTFGGSARMEAGSYGRVGGQAVLNVPISDNLAFRVAGTFTHLGGYIRNLTDGERLGGYDRGTVRAKLKWDNGSRFSATLTGEYHDERDDPVARRLLVGAPDCLACGVFGSVPPPADRFYQVALTPTRDTGIRYTAGTLNLRYEGDSIDLTSVTGVRDFHYKVFVDQDYAAGDLFNSRAEEFGTTLTHDMFVRSHFGGPFNFLAGLSGEIDRDSLLIQVFGAAFGPLQGAGGTSRVNLASISPYGELYYKLTDRVKVTIGGRYNVDHKHLRAINDADSVLALGASRIVDQEATYRDFTPRAVLSYETPRATVYASYSKGAKSGGFNTPAFSPLVPLRSEKLTSYEVGAKANGLNGRISVTGAAFLYDYNDIQVSFVDAATGSVRAENAARARVYGFELNASLRVANGLTVSGGGLIERGRFRSYPSAAIFCPRTVASPSYPGCPAVGPGLGLAAGKADLANARLPRAPEASLYGSIEYDVPISADWLAIVSATDRYTSAYDFLPGAGGPLQLSRQPGYNLLSASLTIAQRDNGIEARVFAENLTGARYYTELPTSAFGAAGTTAAPRTFGASLGYRF